MGLQARFDEASVLLNSLSVSDPELAARVPLEYGRVLNSRGDPELARPRFEAALEAASAGGFEFLAVDALHMLAIVAPPEEQDEWNRCALELAAGADDPRARRWRGSLLNNMGWTAFDRRDLRVALTLFEDALADRQEHGKAAEIRVARWCIARTLREMGRAHEALAIQLELADEHHAAGTSDDFVQEEIAACRAALRENHSAAG